MIKIKKGFAVAMAATALTTGGLGVQTSILIAPAHAQPPPPPGAYEDEDEDEYEDEYEDGDTQSIEDPSGETTEGGGNTEVAAGTNEKPSVNLTEMPAEATLKIHKYETPAASWGTPNNGSAVEPPKDAKPLGGAKFKIQKIEGVELSTNKGWQLAEKLSKTFKADEPATEGEAKASLLKDPGVADLGKATGFGPAVEEVTSGAGLIEKLLPRGLYLVTEVEAPSGHQRSVKPFVVALPMTDPNNTSEWLKEINVYPKNNLQETEEPTKSVKDGKVGAFLAGDADKTPEYTISQKIVDGDKYSRFLLSDYYPPDRLEAPENLVVKVINTTDGSTVEELSLGDRDYVVDTSVVAAPQGGTDPKLAVYTIELTLNGLEKVNQYISEEDRAVLATFNMSVIENTDVENAIAPIVNKFKTIIDREGQPPKQPDPNDPNDPNDPTKPPADPTPGEPDPFPKSYYGNVDIQKKSSDGTDLKGAEFDLYRCENAEALAAKLKDATNKPTALKTGIVVDDTTKGNVEIKGLLANNYQDGSATVTGGKYCLVETKAPVNYELLAQPIDFEVRAEDNNTVGLSSVEVTDTKANGGFDLPLTGGKGVFALLLAGAAFLILGRGYSVYGSRRNNA